ncbi:MFS transporter [Hyphomicrobium sp. CS1GBMeth3]|uniref:MFS transporter n=1 Tax=Hyphomicrobium sp. CS1GBMeth3 TaxID=1892845 RepID=UPI0009318ADD|nr:MFS transporter [Hyphomicrobium sp. CS1GBMeth3]
MTTTTPVRLNLWSREPRIKVLHLTWLAFFVSFIVWFNHAPLMAAIRSSLNLTEQEVSALLILNVALTIPARIVVGMLVDKVGPRLMYSALLVVSGILCILFALADSFTTAAIVRFLLAFVGAGFVVGIRLIAEWFPAKESGFAQGIYAGFGNFGSAAAAVTLPTIALFVGGTDGWRWSVGLTGVVAIAYAVVFYLTVRDTPKGSTYFKPKKLGAMEVTSRGDLLLYMIMQAPLVLAMGILAWKLGPSGLNLLSGDVTNIIYALLATYYVYLILDTWRVNSAVFKGKPVPEIHRYKFRQVAVLSLAYFITFGSELAVVSTLPLFFKDNFALSLAMAGLVGASFGSTTFFARPAGGWLSDRFGRRPVLLCCFAGTATGYYAMSFMGPASGVAFAVLATFFCSLFVNAGNGAVYAMLPLIKRRLTGQIAGLVGAFGNVGGVLYLTLYSAVPPRTFFEIAAAAAVFGVVLIYFFIDEPRGQIAEEMPDGSVTLIDVS